MRRVAAQLVERGQGGDAHFIALRAQQPRRDKAVAAIVARPAEHQDPPPAGALKNLAGRTRDRHGGALHQRHRRHAALDRQAIGASHLIRREDFERESGGHGAMVTEGRRPRNGRRSQDGRRAR